MINEAEDKRILDYFSHIGEHYDFTESDIEAVFEEFSDFVSPGLSDEEKYVQHLVDSHDVNALNEFFNRDMSWLFSSNRPWFNHVD